MSSNMNRGFWDKLPRPFFVLAPLANVTDAAFRRVIATYGKPHALWTEFVSADGLCLADEEGKKRLKKDLLYSEKERPLVAQFFTAVPEHMERVARLAHDLGFDGVDINMGCPDRSVEKQGAGAALIKTPKLAQELIFAAKRGAGNVPVSLKTRLGYNKNEIETWLPALLEAEPAALTVHARTRKEMSKVSAHWDQVKRTVELRDSLKSDTLIVGNGDVIDLGDAQRKAKETSCDGVMLGRAIFGNPWLWSGATPTKEEKLGVLVEHTKLFEELVPHKNFSIMKKHFKAYVSGWEGAKELRGELMDCGSSSEVESVILSL